MKTLYLFLLALCPVTAFAQQNFVVQGDIPKAPLKARALLSYREDGVLKKDSADLVNGRFEFRGTVADISSASLMLINVDAPPAKGKKTDALGLYLVNGTTRISGADSVSTAKVSGTSVNEDNQRFLEMTRSHRSRMSALNAEYTKGMAAKPVDSVNQKRIADEYALVGKEMKESTTKFIEGNPNSYISLVNLQNIAGPFIDPDAIEPMFTKLSAEVRNSKMGKRMADMIAIARKTAVGMMAMNFTQNDPEGKPVNLADFKGKYVLVDFWASWCGPCRKENPNVVAAYNKYKDKGFTVLGVSLDQPGKKDAWLKAIEDDKLTWTHVSDLKYFDNEVAKMYGVQAIPYNLLLDPSGKIIARNIRDKGLHTKLEEVFGGKPASEK